jgi:DNA-binding CsgD family transcriptional regulator
MKLGVSGYLTKQWRKYCGLFKVSNGEEYFVILREKIFNTATKNNSKLNKENSIVDSILTGRELEIIILIALEHSGKEISEKLFISTNTVETHRKNIMKKLKQRTQSAWLSLLLKTN